MTVVMCLGAPPLTLTVPGPGAMSTVVTWSLDIGHIGVITPATGLSLQLDPIFAEL